MRNLFSILTIGLIVIGFVAPIAWIGAAITVLFAIGSAPSGKRPDGKARTAGLFGGLWDNYQVSNTMTDCPFCKSKIMKGVAKCPNCAEWIKEPGSQATDPQPIKYCVHCGTKNRVVVYLCINCSKPT